MEFPGGEHVENLAPNIAAIFGPGPFSHGLNPFDIKSGSEAVVRQVSCGQNIADSTGVGSSQAWDARMMAHRTPAIMAGWGYDVFGRPMPNLNKTLFTLNGADFDANAKDYSIDSNFFDDGRDDPTDLTGGPSFPWGGHAASQYYVGGALDVRYDPRHGLWRTNHFVLAEIMGHKDRHDSDWSTHVREYEWKEVEAGDAFADDILRRGTNPWCQVVGPDKCAADPLDYPARSYRTVGASTEAGGEAINVINPAINLSEMGYNQDSPTSNNGAGGPRPFLGPPVPSGSIVQLRAVNTIFNDENLNQACFAGSYIFSFSVPNKVFVKIEAGTQALNFEKDGPANNGAGQFAGLQEIGSYENTCTRWFYSGKIQKWVGAPATDDNLGYYGSFEDDFSFMNFSDGGFVRMINITEYNNPLAIDGRDEWNHTVAPGVNMAPGPGNYPTGFSIRPIQSGTIVEATYMPNQWMSDEIQGVYYTEGLSGGRGASQGNVGQTNTPVPLFYFQMANAHDGCCASGEVPAEQNDGGCMNPEGPTEVGKLAGYNRIISEVGRKSRIPTSSPHSKPTD
jgi:hypothetical protein